MASFMEELRREQVKRARTHARHAKDTRTHMHAKDTRKHTCTHTTLLLCSVR